MQPFDVYLAFDWWDPETESARPVPAGLAVRVWDRDLLSRDDLLAEGVTDAEGRAALFVPRPGDGRPDLYFELLAPGDSAGGAPIPARWRSLGKFARDYTPGLIEQHEGGDVGRGDAPVTFRLTFDCFLRFVYWNPDYQQYLGVPPRLIVRAMDRGILGRDRALAETRTDKNGCAYLRIEPGWERKPDLYFELEVPGDRPARIDPGRALLAPRGSLEFPRRWSSLDEYTLGDPDRRGYWDDFTGYRIGKPESPYVFDVLEQPPGFVSGHQVRALIDGPDTLAALEAAIDAAKERIHVEVMFLFDDTAGRRIAQRLMARARAGVTVRLMFDVRTTRDVPRHIELRKVWVRALIDLDDAERDAWLARLDAAQAEDAARCELDALLAELHATPNLHLVDASFPYVELDPRQADDDAPAAYQALEAALPPFTIARIDHRKLVVIDDDLALLGGMNFGQEYLYELPLDPALDADAQAARDAAEPWAKWHDCFVELRGPAVAEVQRLFHERWTAEGGDDFALVDRSTLGARRSSGGAAVRVLDTTPGARFHVHSEVLRQINAAKREIWVASAYFSSEEVAFHLRQASRRGVEVTCVFPGARHNDSLDFYYSGWMKYGEMLDVGVRLFEYRHHMNHCKVAIFDDTTLIGSANFNRSSFFNHYEICALVRDRDFTKRFKRDLFERDLQHSVRVGPELVRKGMGVGWAGRLWLEQVVNKRF